MRCADIDKVRYVILGCADCPFYNNGEFRMGLRHSECKHPLRAERVESELFDGHPYLKGVNTDDIICPLREV